MGKSNLITKIGMFWWSVVISHSKDDGSKKAALFQLNNVFLLLSLFPSKLLEQGAKCWDTMSSQFVVSLHCSGQQLNCPDWPTLTTNIPLRDVPCNYYIYYDSIPISKYINI